MTPEQVGDPLVSLPEVMKLQPGHPLAAYAEFELALATSSLCYSPPIMKVPALDIIGLDIADELKDNLRDMKK